MKKFLKKIFGGISAFIIGTQTKVFAANQTSVYGPAPVKTEPVTVVEESVKSNYFFYLFIANGIICLVGIISLCIGLGMKNSRKKKILSCSATTKGKIIDIVKRTYNGRGFDEPSTYMFHPKIE